MAKSVFCLCLAIVSSVKGGQMDDSLKERTTKFNTGGSEAHKRQQDYATSFLRALKIPTRSLSKKSYASSYYNPSPYQSFYPSSYPSYYPSSYPYPAPSSYPYPSDAGYTAGYTTGYPAGYPAGYSVGYPAGQPGGQSSQYHCTITGTPAMNRSETFEIKGKSFKSIGCWSDNSVRAIEILEGKHALLKDPNYKSRANALMKCAEVALEKNLDMFALQNGGQCFGGKDAEKSFRTYGSSTACCGDGEGGPWSNEVYSFLGNDGKPLVNASYNPWSSWSPCPQTCNNGNNSAVQMRNRTCFESQITYITPDMGCGNLGSTTFETRPCGVQICPGVNQTAQTTPAPPPLPTQPGFLNASPKTACRAKVDLGFLIDGSGSIENAGAGNFKRELDFVKQIVSGFEVSRSGTHVGIIIFATDARVVSGFDEHYDKSSTLAAIDNIQYPKGGTSIGRALDLARNSLYARSARPGIPNMLIVLTDGKAQDAITAPAQRLRDSGVTIFVVGIGSGFDMVQLRDMATDPDSQHVYKADFNNLNAVVQSIKDRACMGAGGATQAPHRARAPFFQSVPTISICKAKVDLAILIDGSRSIDYSGAGNFQRCLTFVKNLIRGFNVAKEGTHVGIVVFSQNAQVIFGFETYFNLRAMLTAVDGIRYPRSSTYTGKALDVVRTKLFDASARQGVPNVLLVMTDGASQDDIDQPSKRLRNMGVTVFSLGVGNAFDVNQLNTMATDPDRDHVFTADFSKLGSSVIEKIKNKACRGSGGAIQSIAASRLTSGQTIPRCLQPLGMENRFIPDAQITASSEWNSQHGASNGRLNFQAGGGRTGAWSARSNDLNQWLQVDLGRMTEVTGIRTQGRSDANQWVTSYSVSYSNDGTHFASYKNAVFNGNRDRNTVVLNRFTPPIVARYIRVRPKSWYRHISMRIELLGCSSASRQLPLGQTISQVSFGHRTSRCLQPLGMENRHIPDAQITASSEWNSQHGASNGRLNFQAGGGRTGAWSAKSNDPNQWLQVDLGRMTEVTGIRTQGRSDTNQWVTSYSVSFGNDGTHFGSYKNAVFNGNRDRNTVVLNRFTPPIVARYIRVHPKSWYRHISMRIELLGCSSAVPASIIIENDGNGGVLFWKLKGAHAYLDVNDLRAMNRDSARRIPLGQTISLLPYGQRTPRYYTIGCYKDTGHDRAIQILEGTDPILDGSYESRRNPIEKCARVAWRRGYQMFAVQHSGQCFSSATAPQTYDKFGRSNSCAADGEGGPFANQVYVFRGVGRFRADEIDEYKLVHRGKYKGGVIGKGGIKDQLGSDENEQTAYEAALEGHLEVPNGKDQNRDGGRYSGNKTQVGLGAKIDINQIPGQDSVERVQGKANGFETTVEISKMKNGRRNLTDNQNERTANGFETTGEIDKTENRGTNLTENKNEGKANGFETTSEIDKMENGDKNLTGNQNEGKANGFETIPDINKTENGDTNVTTNENDGTTNGFDTTGNIDEMENGDTNSTTNDNEGTTNGFDSAGNIDKMENGGTNSTDNQNEGTANGLETTGEIEKMENGDTNLTDNENEGTTNGFDTMGEMDEMENGGTNLKDNENEGTANGFDTMGEMNKMENGGTNLKDNEDEGTANDFETMGQIDKMENAGTNLRDNQNEQEVPFYGQIESLENGSIDKGKDVTIRQSFPNIANENTVLGLGGGATPFEERLGSIIEEPGTTTEANILRNKDSSSFTGIPFFRRLTGESTPFEQRPGSIIEERGTTAEGDLFRNEASSRFTGIPLFAGVDGRAETRSVKGNTHPKPVALYPLNVRYQAKDVIGGNVPGKVNNVVPAAGPFKHGGNSLSFLGRPDSYIEFPNNGKLDVNRSVSLLAWVLPEKAGPIFNYRTDGWGVNFWMAMPRKLFARFVDRKQKALLPAIKSTHIKPNKWNFVGATYDQNSGVASLWINGKQEDKKYIGIISLATNYPVRMGARIGDKRNFRGRISCMQVYNVALSRKQVNEAKMKCKSFA